MSTPHEDDALSWEGDDDPTLSPAPSSAPAGARRAPRSDPEATAPPAASGREPSELPEGFTAVGRGSETVRPAHAEPTTLGNAGLVGVGMIAAAFILFSVGWLIVSFRLQDVGGLPVPAPTLVAITIAAAAAPLVWFATVYALTRRSRTWVRFAWLIAGVVLLVPWPFIGTGALS